MTAFPIRGSSAEPAVTLHRTDFEQDPLRRYRNHVDDWLAMPWRRLVPIFRELAPDLVHTNNLPGISTGIWEQASRAGIPVVHTLHDYHLLCPRTTLTGSDGTACRPSPLVCGIRSRRLARRASAVNVVIGVSAHVLGRHESFFPRQTGRSVIRPPLIRASPPPASRPEAARPARLGYLGALRTFKGVELLVSAAPALAELGVEVAIAGAGPLQTRVSSTPSIRYAGHLRGASVARFLESCDLGLVPSLWEEPGLSYVLLEWLGAGKPVLATRRGGLAEAAALGGVETFDGTASGLVQSVRALQDRARWGALQKALPSVTGSGDLDRWLDDHLAVYRRAIVEGVWTA